MDEAAIARARRYSKRHGTSVSELVSRFLASLDDARRLRRRSCRDFEGSCRRRRRLRITGDTSRRSTWGEALPRHERRSGRAGEQGAFADEAAVVLSLIERGDAEGFIAAHTVTTLHYLLQRAVGGRKARRALADVLKLVEVVAVDHDRLLQALGMNWKDFEDAVQAACAQRLRWTTSSPETRLTSRRRISTSLLRVSCSRLCSSPRSS